MREATIKVTLVIDLAAKEDEYKLPTPGEIAEEIEWLVRTDPTVRAVTVRAEYGE